MTRFIALALAASVACMPFADGIAATTKKNKRDTYTAEQKKELRKKGREWCQKNFLKGGTGMIMRVEIMADGRVRCWYKL